MLHNDLCEKLGIEFPIFAFSHCRDVVVAVCKAGGLGVLGAVEMDAEQLDRELSIIEAELDGRPYGVDIVIPAKLAVAEEFGDITEEKLREFIPEDHQSYVAEVLEAHDVEPLPEGTPRRPGLISWAGDGASSLVDVALKHDVALIANALGTPPADVVDRVHQSGRLVAALAGKARHARKHVDAGVDIVIAQGYEAGGHTGEVASMVLIPEIVDEVSPVPVLAAGGIGGGRQMAAAMALGASGVWCGSVWLTTQESDSHPVLKEKLLKASSSDTERSRSLTGKPARQIRTEWTEAWNGESGPKPLEMPLQTILVVEALQRIDRSAKGPDDGPGRLLGGAVGQIVGRMNTSLPAGRVVMDMVEEFLEVAESFSDELDH